ncbi:inositol monophosphatase family protein [Ferviditalea candida]|uniref:Inositol-1-monophosphatase n=1 Tax=Ferviditalea candida TaxID=3108399 RepID=A0ABU5ZK87_9BACL|nr:inositol monophosphatase family protein [Paenibacillaceae bacterium T2]
MVQQSEIPYVIGNKSFTAVAINTAAKAGEWIKSKLGEFNSLNRKSSHRDLVTEIDKGAEAMIRNLLHTYFPEHSFLGEESVGQESESFEKAIRGAMEAEYMWIVDPIDGTTNFVHGFPFYSVSIALAHKGEVIVGVVYDPSRDEIFVAEKGKGAYVGGQKMRVSAESKLTESLIATGFPVSRQEAYDVNMKGIGALASRVRNIRTTGSAALHMAYVAAGRLSGFWEVGLNPWDLAAGVLLVTESGGRVTDMNGEPYSLKLRNVLASNGAIHDEFQRVLEDEGAVL